MTVDHCLRQTQLNTQLAHFILEQLLERLNQLKLHVFRQATDIMMRLDHPCLAVLDGDRLDNVRVDGALCQKVDAFQFGGFLIEHFDKGTANDFAFFFRVADALEPLKEALLGIHADNLDAHVVSKHAHNLITFVQTQQTVVDNTQVSWLPMARCSNAATTDESTPPDRPSRTWRSPTGAYAGNGIFDDIGRRPQAGTTAVLQHKLLDQARAACVVIVRNFLHSGGSLACS